MIRKSTSSPIYIMQNIVIRIKEKQQNSQYLQFLLTVLITIYASWPPKKVAGTTSPENTRHRTFQLSLHQHSTLESTPSSSSSSKHFQATLIIYPVLVYFSGIVLVQMYSQKLLAALYVLLGATLTKPTECLSSNSQKLSNGFVGLKCQPPHASHLNSAAGADIQPVDRLGCAIALSCLPEGIYGPTILNNKSMLPLNITITLSENVAMGTQRCKKEIKKLLFGAREDEQEVGTPSVQRQVGPKRPSFFHSRQEGSSETNSERKGYQGIVEYLMSTIQRRAVQAVDSVKEQKMNYQDDLASHSARNSTSNFSMDLKQVIFKRHPFSYYVTQCEESFCNGYDLQNICDPNSRIRRKAIFKSTCDYCYPQRENTFIKSHCERRVKKEMRAFYGICALLTVSIVVAVILYVLHRTGRLLRINCRLIRGMRGNKFSSNPVTSNRFSSAVFSDSHIGSTRLSEDTTISNPDYDNSTTFSSFQRKFSQLGTSSRGYRKRIQDVFDIESLEPRNVKDEALKDGVYVLPRAPNVTVRRKSADSLRRVRGEPRGPGWLEMEEVQSDTVRRVFPHDQSVV